MEGVDVGGSEKVKKSGSSSNGGNGGGVKEALKKCLEENKGNLAKCKPKVEALKSLSKTPAKGPLRLRSGSLTDV